MDNDQIQLIILTESESQSWIYGKEYTESWPGCDRALFLDASKISQEASIEYKPLTISKDASISEVIMRVRHLFPGFEKDSEKFFGRSPFYFDGKESGEWPITYSLLSPLNDYKMLPETKRLSELGITCDEVLVIRKIVHSPELRFAAHMASVKHFEHFQEMVLPTGVPEKRENIYSSQVELFAVLLYTDEDIALAKYVRENFDNLHKMSGTKLRVFVVEKKPNDNVYSLSQYWKNLLEQTTYYAWSLVGWTRSKPYDKSAVYDIAHSLNIYPDELPCLAVFANTDQMDKAIFPIGNDFSTFFRSAFSGIQRSLQGLEPQIAHNWLEYKSSLGDTWAVRKQRHEEAKDKMQRELFDRVRKSMKQVYEANDTDRTVYNFYGQTVLINHQIETSGGTYVEGNVSTGKDFIGRDKFEQ